MNRICLYFLVGILALAVTGNCAESTTWKGTLNAGGTKLRLEIDIIEKEGKLSGELRSLDQGNAKLPVSEIENHDGKLKFSVPQARAEFSGKYEQNGEFVKGTFSQNGAEIPLTLSKSGPHDKEEIKERKGTLKEAWIGELNMGVIQPVMQFRIMSRESGETVAFLDSITEGVSDIDASWSIDGDILKFEVPRIKLEFTGTLNETRDQAEGTWNQGGRKLPMTLKKQATAYQNKNTWENRPQRPVGPFPYDAEEVFFENKIDNVTLAGTLTIPKGEGTHPAVVLISGSGPQDRDETLMEHKPFLVLADYLTRRGLAVLRYDDRGTAASTGKFSKATTEDLARDASAAVDFLKAHKRIRPNEIGLAGHSEGGLIAPIVCGMRNDVSFAALLAGTGVDGATIITSQTEAMLRVAGTDEDELELGMKINRAIVGAVAAAKPDADFTKDVEQAVEKVIQTIPETEREEAGPKIREGVKGQLGRLKGPWMRFFLTYDPRPALEKLKCPVLVIIGSKDVQVLPDLNLPEMEKALTKGGNRDFKIVELPDLNHLFQKCETGSLNEYATIQETFNPGALKKIGDWIVAHTSLAASEASKK